MSSLPTYTELLERLEGTPQATFMLGLEAMSAAVHAEGLTRPAKFVVIIAGTNGKGTVASTLNAMCVGAGLKTGLFTSPHLVEYRERIRINGLAVSEDDFVRIGAPIVDRWGAESAASPRPLSYFEMGALLGLAAFKDAECDVAILEVGLGGRLDATNVVDADLAIITSISLDHTDYLGDTIAQIAGEKAAVARRGRPVLLHANHGGVEEARSALTEIGAVVDVVESTAAQPIETNRELAAAAFRTVAAHFRVDADQGIAWGLSHVRWPGRQEILIDGERALRIDGAHNPESIAALLAWLREGDAKPATAIVSLSGGRLAKDSLWPIRDYVTRWLVCAPNFARSRRVEDVAEELRELERGSSNPLVIEEFPSVKDAVERSAELGDALVFGSLYLVGEVYAALGFGRERIPSILS